MQNFEDILPLKNWISSDGAIPLILGPCSLESYEQIYETAKAIKDLNIPMACLRAGIWKPRTRPNSFEGLGEEALPWLLEVKKTLGIPTAVEVASVAHVELALKYDVDVLWLGARTTVNPFLVQEIADALIGMDIPLMIKNPVNPDLALWIGAVERVYQAGIRKLAVIHRGFSAYQKGQYRNPPTWQIPIELKRRYPNLSLICDPSHITGDRSMILQTSQKALDLNYDGLMIETHIDPDNALSDAKQQVTPNALKDIFDQLKTKTPNTKDSSFLESLAELRSRIDVYDQELIEALASRTSLVKRIGEVKKQNNISILQLQRWKEVLETRSEWAKGADINPELIQQIYEMIHIESINLQSDS